MWETIGITCGKPNHNNSGFWMFMVDISMFTTVYKATYNWRGTTLYEHHVFLRLIQSPHGRKVCPGLPHLQLGAPDPKKIGVSKYHKGKILEILLLKILKKSISTVFPFMICPLRFSNTSASSPSAARSIRACECYNPRLERWLPLPDMCPAGKAWDASQWHTQWHTMDARDFWAQFKS